MLDFCFPFLHEEMFCGSVEVVLTSCAHIWKALPVRGRSQTQRLPERELTSMFEAAGESETENERTKEGSNMVISLGLSAGRCLQQEDLLLA